MKLCVMKSEKLTAGMEVYMNIWLIIAGALSALAAVLHLGCIYFGATWYRFFGAGEQIVSNLQDGGGLDLDPAVGTISFGVTPPASSITTQTIARFRWSNVNGLDATTMAANGEVEDYAVTVAVGGQALSGIV